MQAYKYSAKNVTADINKTKETNFTTSKIKFITNSTIQHNQSNSSVGTPLIQFHQLSYHPSNIYNLYSTAAIVKNVIKVMK